LLATLLQIFDSPQFPVALKQPTATFFFWRITVNHPGARISASNLSFREGFKAQSDLIKSILIAIIAAASELYNYKTTPTWRLCSFVRQWLPGVCKVNGRDKSIYSKSG